MNRVYVHGMCVCRHCVDAHITEHVCKVEDNFVESVLFCTSTLVLEIDLKLSCLHHSIASVLSY